MIGKKVMSWAAALGCLGVLLGGLIACAGDTGDTGDRENVQHESAPLAVIGKLHNACGNEGTTPTIQAQTFVTPAALDAAGTAPANFNPLEGRMTLNNVQYVSGATLRLDITTDGCTYVESVQYGARVLTGTYTDGYWFDALDDQNDATTHKITLWMFSPADDDGRTDAVNVVIGRQFGPGTATIAFPLVHVHAVRPSLVDSPFGLSGTQLFNLFAEGLDKKFQGSVNSTVVNGRRIYDYDPASLQVSIDGTGIWVSFRFKADVGGNYVCDPTVQVTGTFALDTDNVKGLSVRWVNPMHASLDWGACEYIVDVPLVGVLADIAITVIGDHGSGSATQGALTTEILASLPDVSSALLVLDGTTTLADELRVNLKLPAPSVELRVPYDAFALPRSGFTLPAKHRVSLVAAQLGMTDAVAGQARTLASGPEGVKLRAALPLAIERGVLRSGALVDNASNVGRVLAQRRDSLGQETFTFRYAAGCTIASSALLSTPITFGVNDTTADAQRLRNVNGASGYSVRLAFDLPGSGCSAFSTGTVATGGGSFSM
jgi:hypothetical protein